MKRKLSRRDFLKLAGAGTAVVGTAVGIGVYRSALGEYPLERSPYVETLHTTDLDGSVPLLLIVNKNSPNPFGMYLGEILRAEGVNCFHTTDLSTLQPASLEKYDIAILAETPLSAAQAEMFTAYVARGGRLVGMKPADRLGAVFGVEGSEGELSEGYIKTAEGHPVGRGINPSTLQFHGSANLHPLAGGEAVAWLYRDRNAAAGRPAVVLNAFGEGLAGAWTFDLARSVVLMRQGNPALADQDLDGLQGVRTVDKFVGWIDLERIAIPQADEQQRLFVNLLMRLSEGRRPLPRLWYFPEDKKSILIATGDSHMNPVNFIEDVLSRVEARGGHFTVYYSPVIVSDFGRAERALRFWVTDHVPLVGDILDESFGSPTPADVAGWRDRGHEFALHPYVDYDLEDGWQIYWKEFTGRGYGPVPPTVRSHRVLWTGWTESARLQASYGMRMNVGYYHVGPSLQKRDGEWVYGHLTGSGRPMRFMDAQGRMLDIYQQLTQLADEHLIPMDVPGWGGWPQLSAQEAVEVSKYLLDRSVKHDDYCAICGQFHVDPFQLGGDPAEKAGIFLEGTLDYANELGVPIWSSLDWLNFTEKRDGTDFADVQWNPAVSRLTLRLVPGGASRLLPSEQPDSTLTVLLPITHTDKTLSTISVDNVTTSISTRLVLGGAEYALIILSAQEHAITATYS